MGHGARADAFRKEGRLGTARSERIPRPAALLAALTNRRHPGPARLGSAFEDQPVKYGLAAAQWQAASQLHPFVTYLMQRQDHQRS